MSERYPDGLGLPTSNEESDDKNKIQVAEKFLTGEAEGDGMSQVTQRICAMAIRSWELKTAMRGTGASADGA